MKIFFVHNVQKKKYYTKQKTDNRKVDRLKIGHFLKGCFEPGQKGATVEVSRCPL